MKTRKTIGLLCGTFNPIHIGHLALANFFHAFSPIDEVWFVVSPHNPLKEKNQLLLDAERLRMVQLSVADFPAFSACDVEFHLPQPSYTIDTLNFLTKKYPETDFILLIGEDNLEIFDQWKNYKEILDNFRIYVYNRTGETHNGRFMNEKNVVFFKAPLLDISSTWIRDALKTGKDIRFFLPEKIFGYILKNGFYQ